ncbi:uncharacterized protein LOC114907583 [Monodon monoceros]|uniref:uncharacterized protein LOC114907583 n=1 Tax=Monodon monoceros TaxID=40151 RepID=UPI0010F502B9|nr:uncharacterized protein LOC114907583 [Monodon monoceros]
MAGRSFGFTPSSQPFNFAPLSLLVTLSGLHGLSARPLNPSSPTPLYEFPEPPLHREVGPEPRQPDFAPFSPGIAHTPSLAIPNPPKPASANQKPVAGTPVSVPAGRWGTLGPAVLEITLALFLSGRGGGSEHSEGGVPSAGRAGPRIRGFNRGRSLGCCGSLVAKGQGMPGAKKPFRRKMLEQGQGCAGVPEETEIQRAEKRVKQHHEDATSTVQMLGTLRTG